MFPTPSARTGVVDQGLLPGEVPGPSEAEPTEPPSTPPATASVRPEPPPAPPEVASERPKPSPAPPETASARPETLSTRVVAAESHGAAVPESVLSGPALQGTAVVTASPSDAVLAAAAVDPVPAAADVAAVVGVVAVADVAVVASVEVGVEVGSVSPVLVTGRTAFGPAAATMNAPTLPPTGACRFPLSLNVAESPGLSRSSRSAGPPRESEPEAELEVEPDSGP